MEKDKKYQNILKNWKTPFSEDKSASWEAIQAKIEAQSTTKVVKLRRSWWYAAASVAAVLALMWMLIPAASMTQVAQLEKGSSPYILPDGSSVWLNANSTMEFDAEAWQNDRNLELNGEAFFEVKKGSEFTVQTVHGNVKVLGTSFNVYTRGTDFEVSCFTGKVRVANQSSAVELTPGERAVKRDDRLTEIEFAEEKLPGWQTGNYEYEDVPVRRIFDELELQMGVKILADVDAGTTFTGEFNLNDLQTALATICLPLNLNYEITDDMTVIVSRK